MEKDSKSQNQLIPATVFLSLKEKIAVAITFILAVALIVLGACIPLIIDYLINNKVHDQVVMTPDNINLWGAIPGDSQVTFHRNCVFYQFLNPYDAIFRNHKPQILEVPGYSKLITQYENCLFITDLRMT